MANSNTFTFTDEELHWLRVALENSKDRARVLAAEDDPDDRKDAEVLIDAYNGLQHIIGETGPISLTDL